MELAGTLFFTIPGPKMIWEFGEMGYDFSINTNCRICSKPITWYYLTIPNRVHQFKVWKALINLRTTYPAFQTTNYTINFGGSIKTIQLNDASMNVVAAGNFDVQPNAATPGFQHTGWWYDYFTGDSINITNTGQSINYREGEYHLYTDVALPLPDLSTNYYNIAGIEQFEAGNGNSAVLYPNPNDGNFNLTFSMPGAGNAKLEVYDVSGKLIYSSHQTLPSGIQNIRFDISAGNMHKVSAGMYFYRLLAGQCIYNGKISVVNN